MSGRTVLALLDRTAVEAGGLSPTARELLEVARGLAGGLDGPLELAWTGELPEAVRLALGGLGVVRVRHLAEEPSSSAELASALEAHVRAERPAVLLATTSFASRELAGRLGVRLGAGVLVDALHLELDRGRVVAERSSFAASWGSRCEVLAEPAIVTVKPHATVGGAPAPASVVGPEGPEIVPLAPGEPDARVRVVERTRRETSGRPDLATAATVVAGGRGFEGDFSLLEELADELGAAVGATRVAVDEGWVGHELQVGQTGVTINPLLYIGAGISGAIHHVGGMRAARTVVAINTEPDAPLMEIADYAIVGDLFEVLPRLTARLRELRGSRT